MVNSSHGHVVTRSTCHRSTRHTCVSSHSQLITSEHITKPPVVIFLSACRSAPRNSAQHRRRTYSKRAISKSPTTAKLLNGMNARSKRTVNSSQHRETRRSTRHTILRRDELTVWRVDWFPQYWSIITWILFCSLLKNWNNISYFPVLRNNTHTYWLVKISQHIRTRALRILPYASYGPTLHTLTSDVWPTWLLDNYVA